MNALLLLVLVVSSVATSGPPIPKPVPTPTPSAETVRPYQLPANFTFEIDGVIVTGVTGIDGLQKIIVERKLGQDWVPQVAPSYRQAVPGKSEWLPIKLMRGKITDKNSLFEWHLKVIEGKIDQARSDCTLDTTTPLGRPVEFAFQKCWPVHWEGVRLSAGTPGYASETVVIQYDSLHIK